MAEGLKHSLAYCVMLFWDLVRASHLGGSRIFGAQEFFSIGLLKVKYILSITYKFLMTKFEHYIQFEHYNLRMREPLYKSLHP